MLLDRWREILEMLWRRKLRTTLTAMAVAWGIFMLVVLLAAGRGLSNGAEAEFAQDALNSVWVAGGRVSLPHEGTPKGSPVRLLAEDEGATRAAVKIVDRSSALVHLGQLTISRRGRHALFDVTGCLPDNAVIEKNEVVAGRFLDDRDQGARRKVAVIGVQVRRALFGNDDPLGAMVQVGPWPFTVVGVIDEEHDEFEQRAVYIPLGTAQLVWGRGQHIDNYLFTVGEATAVQTDVALDEVRALVAARHHFDPKDRQALRAWNNVELSERFQGMFRGIRAFVWIIGLGTVLAGVMGVSNIMLIAVQERTREIGVRKAVGAPPSSIVVMIVEEAVVITVVSGYLGLLAAVLLVNSVRGAVAGTFFRNPELDLGAGLAATAVLVVAGTLAGLVPALRAARVNPIVALRVE